MTRSPRAPVVLVCVIFWAITAVTCPAIAAPGSSDPVTVALGQANAAAIAGDWDRVAVLLEVLAAPNVALSPTDRAEVNRLVGLAAFFDGRFVDADRAWLAYLRHDVDARLDPATVPPEAIAFFEDIRARHAAELRALRPKTRRRWAILNFVPVAGLLQNGDTTKAWIFGSVLVGFAGIHVGSYFLLRSWCNQGDRTCSSGSADRSQSARSLRIVNILAGAGAITTYIVGVVDAFRSGRRGPAIQVEETASGGAITLSSEF